MAATPPLGYSLKAEPQSRAETYHELVADKAVSITKSALQGFLDSFLNPKGSNRQYLNSTISSEGLSYVTSLTYDEEMKASPNKRKTYLARFFQENTGQLPSILIIDAGMEDGDPGINSLVQGFGFQNQWYATGTYMVKVSLSIQVATYSEEDTSTLSGVIYYILTSLVDFIKAHLIKDPGSKWEVRLPLAGITAGQLTGSSVEGDVKKQYWLRSIDLTVDFETAIEMRMPTPKILLPAIGVVGEGAPLPRVLNLVPNQSVSLGSSYTLFIENMQLKHTLGVSDPSVALVSKEEPLWYLQPRRQGSCVLYIFDSTLPVGNSLHSPNPRLVSDIPFKVTL